MNKLISATELAAHLGAHPFVVRGWARQGKIPAHRIGGAWRFDLAEVLAATRTTAN